MIIIYFRIPPVKDRFIYGDRFLLPLIRRLIRGKKVSGIERVFLNLCQAFEEQGIKFMVNKPFKKIEPHDQVIVLGVGRYSLEGYHQPNKIIAGIALMTHPTEWIDLCKNYPVVKYLQHSEWAKNVYTPYFGVDVCDTWFAGIDTNKWRPALSAGKKYDILIYNKLKFNSLENSDRLKYKITDWLNQTTFSFTEVNYGNYKEGEYKILLQNCKAMIFLSGHESQGFACCEALAMNIPVFAWDQGYCLDPNRFKWGDPIIHASSVPFFNKQCGEKFTDFEDFQDKFPSFFKKVLSNHFSPRSYILKNLSLKKSAYRMLSILKEVYK